MNIVEKSVFARARITEISLENESRGAKIELIDFNSIKSCAPGQYLTGWSTGEPDLPLPVTLFISEIENHHFHISSPIPSRWLPGDEIFLRGPFGHGFEIPDQIRKLALVGMDRSIGRLLSLLRTATQKGWEVTLFSDVPAPVAPIFMEIYPLSELSTSIQWADFIALDIPVEKLPSLKKILKPESSVGIPVPAQILPYSEMPCAGTADCGACGIETRHGWKWICKDGPVFDLKEIKW